MTRSGTCSRCSSSREVTFAAFREVSAAPETPRSVDIRGRRRTRRGSRASAAPSRWIRENPARHPAAPANLTTNPHRYENPAFPPESVPHLSRCVAAWQLRAATRRLRHTTLAGIRHEKHLSFAKQHRYPAPVRGCRIRRPARCGPDAAGGGDRHPLSRRWPGRMAWLQGDGRIERRPGSVHAAASALQTPAGRSARRMVTVPPLARPSRLLLATRTSVQLPTTSLTAPATRPTLMHRTGGADSSRFCP